MAKSAKKNKSKVFKILLLVGGILLAVVVLMVAYSQLTNWLNYRSIDQKMDTLNYRLHAVDDSVWKTTKKCYLPKLKFRDGQLYCEIYSSTSYEIKSVDETRPIIDRYQQVVSSSDDIIKSTEVPGGTVYFDDNLSLLTHESQNRYEDKISSGVKMMLENSKTGACEISYRVIRNERNDDTARLMVATRCNFDANHEYYPLEEV